MFYQWEGPCAFDGARAYIDLSDHLHRILQSRAFSADIVFCTEDPGYLPLLAVYYKESLLPDFSLCLHKGLPALTIRRGGGLKVLTGGEAVCDGQRHLVSFRGCEAGVRVYLDGELAAEDQAPGPWCEFGYVGFFTAGRGTQADVYQYFRGELFSLSLSDQEESLPDWRAAERLPRQDLFARGMAGVENYRIPCLLTVGDTTVACADARVEAPGDNPNHICRAVRISRDSGKTWSPIRLLCDYGGVGRADGAAAIDYGCAGIRVGGIVRRAVRERHTVDVGSAGRNLFGSVPHALLTKSHFHDSGLFSVRGISGPESDELNLLCRRSPQFEDGAILVVCRAKVVAVVCILPVELIGAHHGACNGVSGT